MKRLLADLRDAPSFHVQGLIDAVREVLRYTGHNARIELPAEMPTGPMNRVVDNSLARRLLGWEPKVKLIDSLHRTIDWYFATKDQEAVHRILEEGGLIERKVASIKHSEMKFLILSTD